MKKKMKNCETNLCTVYDLLLVKLIYVLCMIYCW